jgi:hypothetical protein
MNSAPEQPLKSYDSPLKAVWNLTYSIEQDKLGRLYEKAKRDQWNADQVLDWDSKIELGLLVDRPENHIWGSCKFVQGLPKAKRDALLLNNVAFDLSQFLHGEQAALMVAAQLVSAVPNYEAKLYAATQVMDEARHLQIFERYCRLIGRIYPVQQELELAMDDVLQTPLWQSKLVSMQMLVEGTALAAFLNMRRSAREPLLMNLLDFVLKDESRHVGFGTLYLTKMVQTMAPDERAQVEDFTLQTIQALRPVRMGTVRRGAFTEVLVDSGIDPEEFAAAVSREVEDGWKPTVMPGQVHNFKDVMMPLVARIGLVSDRIAPRYKELGIRVFEETAALDTIEERSEGIEIPRT